MDTELLEILTEPDERLLRVSEAVPVVDDQVRDTLKRMMHTMYQAQGIGLAAPQVNIHQRMLVMDIKDNPRKIINPQIVWASEEKSPCKEGCLSVPDFYAVVYRPARVRIQYLDECAHQQEDEFQGLEATCVQHEIDHLNGILFLNYLSPLKRQMWYRKYAKRLKP